MTGTNWNTESHHISFLPSILPFPATIGSFTAVFLIPLVTNPKKVKKD